MSPSPPFGRFVRYLAIIFGAGLMGWAIGDGPGFAIGIGAGIVVAGAVWRLAIAFEEPGPRPEIRVVLDQAAFGRLIRGMWVARPGVRIILADIGFATMAAELGDAAAHAEDQGRRALDTLEDISGVP